MPRSTASPRFVYRFRAGAADGGAGDRELLGGKGANLAEMCRMGLPVPPGFTLSTDVSRAFDTARGLPAGLEAEIDDALAAVADAVGRRFGAASDPLLLSVRSGARVSMPGMMETVLDVGLTRETLPGLIAASGDRRFAWDSYRRLLTMYADVVMEKAGVGLDRGRTGSAREIADGDGIRERLEERLAESRRTAGVATDAELSAEALEELVERYEQTIEETLGVPFPQDPRAQLLGAIEAVLRSWNGKRARQYRHLEGIPDAWGTAVNVQAMVFGNLEGSATGVAFTRNPATGENVFYGEWLPRAQGEDVVSGARTPYALNEASRNAANRELPTLEGTMPEVYAELLEVRERLEQHFGDMQDLEMTVERGRLWVLQTRTGKRNGRAAVRVAVDMVGEGLVDRRTAVLRVRPEQLDELLHPRLDDAVTGASDVPEPLATGLPAGPGAAVGRLALSAEVARERADAGEAVVLMRTETSAEDVDGMHASVAIVTARGGMTSHAALVARGWGKTCVVGVGALDIDLETRSVRVDGADRADGIAPVTLHEGDEVTVDGTAGRLWRGALPLVEGDPESDPALATLLGWCDEIRRLEVQANADRPEDAALARRFGAEGIGLCRTEHMFFGDERILAIREMILADDEASRAQALERLLPLQREDFRGLLRAMEGFTVVVRLLDPPLHEFLPRDEASQQSVAASLGVSVERVRERVEELAESNPMLGHRGCRLGVSHPEITRMQARAVLEATASLRAEGVDARAAIMVPLVGHVAELLQQKAIVLEVSASVRAASEQPDLTVPVGTMIEVPRAALTADEIAREADLFSFGTNDLTQMTLGLSRDDAAPVLRAWSQIGAYARDPFASLDRDGVGRLVRMAAERGRATRPDLHLGICGEHGGDPDSIAFCHRIGLDAVSCSPFRVPVARLAAAQAAACEADTEDDGASAAEAGERPRECPDAEVLSDLWLG